jgi:hypothetical protein
MEYDEAGRNKGTAVAWYENSQDAILAINTYDRRQLDGLALSVEDCGGDRRGSDERDERYGGDVMSRLGPPVRNGDDGGRRDERGGREDRGEREDRGGRDRSGRDGGSRRGGRSGGRGGREVRRVVTHEDLDMELDMEMNNSNRKLVEYADAE